MNWKNLRWLFALTALLLGGCSGINTTQSISPLDFLMPGAGRLLHMQNTAPQSLPATNAYIAALQPIPSPAVIPE